MCLQTILALRPHDAFFGYVLFNLGFGEGLERTCRAFSVIDVFYGSIGGVEHWCQRLRKDFKRALPGVSLITLLSLT
jgi:hypothetical protein